ncbi:MAG: DUF3572 domain-containing protein [Sneathiella sp.]
MNQELADIIALQAVTYLLSDEKRISWLLGDTGLSSDDLRQAPNSPDILAGIIDFLLSHENILVDFCTECEIDPTLLQQIRPFFPGAYQEFTFP